MLALIWPHVINDLWTAYVEAFRKFMTLSLSWHVVAGILWKNLWCVWVVVYITLHFIKVSYGLKLHAVVIGKQTNQLGAMWMGFEICLRCQFSSDVSHRKCTITFVGIEVCNDGKWQQWGTYLVLKCKWHNANDVVLARTGDMWPILVLESKTCHSAET